MSARRLAARSRAVEAPPFGRAEREELRRLLRSGAILHAEPGRPITGRDGRPAPWTLYTPAITLTPRGAALAGACLRSLLAGFRSTQIASYGYTGLPLLAACLSGAPPGYTGLMIREARKARGTGRRVEGPLDRVRPAVIVDDSISSGASLRAAIEALADEGVAVEGAVCLVRFPYRGGVEWAEALGYRIATAFDVWEDLGMERPVYVPGYLRAMPDAWAADAVPDGLHPADAARVVAERFLADGSVLRPPRALDHPYDGGGGAFVSFREAATDRRLARDGFFHFDPGAADPARDVVLATIRTLRIAGGAIDTARLAGLKIAVTFLSALEPVAPGSLDFDTFGVVVRSRHWPTKIGGALPHTQVFISEVEQERHARVTNARVGPHEPYDLYRYRVAKYPEPGAYWLPFGATVEPSHDWTRDPTIGARLVERARSVLTAGADRRTTGALPDDLVPARASAVAVSLYAHGTAGCGVAWVRESLDDALVRAATFAGADGRFAQRRATVALEELDVAVSVLHDREWLGTTDAARVARKLRPGLDAFSAHRGDRHGVFLETVIPHHDWSRETAVARLLEKAGIQAGPAAWATYRATSWLASPHGVSRLAFGYPAREPGDAGRDDVTQAIERSASYLVRTMDAWGVPAYLVQPVEGRVVRQGHAARQVHALGALLAAGRAMGRLDWEGAATRGARAFVESLPSRGPGGNVEAAEPSDEPPRHGAVPGPLVEGAPAGSASAEAALASAPGTGARVDGNLARFVLVDLAAQAGLADGVPVRRLARSLRTWFLRDGRVAAPGGVSRLREDHDYLPGVALLAFARARARTGLPEYRIPLRRHLAWYRRRFRLTGSWGLAAWHMQAWTAAHAVDPVDAYAAFVFELADWSLERQLDTSGAFLTDLYAGGPSFHTAFVAEGIADAWALARTCGEAGRAARYADAWRRAMGFMRQLAIEPRDTYCMPLGEAAVGGVRASLARSDVRVDYVGHTLTALVHGAALMASGTP